MTDQRRPAAADDGTTDADDDRQSVSDVMHDQFLSDAVLRYDGTDGPDRRSSARALLAQHPALPGHSIWAAAAAADHVALSAFLSADSSVATVPGGPQNWAPILYLTYSRSTPQIAADEVERCLRLLLDAGADPNAGYLPSGVSTPFTALTGLFGGGEEESAEKAGAEKYGSAKDGAEKGGGGSGHGNAEHSVAAQRRGRISIGDDGSDHAAPDNQAQHHDGTAQPAHPHLHRLAAVLLAAGADPNDAQTLYNRMFAPSDDHLELLFEHGLGTGDGGPWRRRDPTGTDSPEQMLRGQLAWAVTQGFTRRIALLARHGVDLRAPLDAGHLPMRTARTALELAVVAGRRESTHALRELGVDDRLDPATELIGALLDADVDTVEQIRAAHPGLLATVRHTTPSLVLRAAVVDRPDAIALLARYSFDVNALGRADIVMEQPWETALHHAAGVGNLPVIGVLLRCGADREVKDRRFGATPLGWAEFFHHADAAALLA